MSIPIPCTRHFLSYMSKFISLTTTSKQISIQSPLTNINTSSKHRATQTTPKKAIPFSLFLRIRRICSADTFFDQRSRELIEYLTKRGYSRTSLQRDANRVRPIPRHATLQPQEQKSAETDRTPFVTSFNPGLPKISTAVNKYTTLLAATANWKKAFPKPPVIAYRRNASLRDLLVNSTLSHENSSSQQPAGITVIHYVLSVLRLNLWCRRKTKTDLIGVFKVAGYSFQYFSRLRVWWIIITILYWLTPKSW